MIHNFGTHFTSKVHVGGAIQKKYIIDSEIAELAGQGSLQDSVKGLIEAYEEDVKVRLLSKPHVHSVSNTPIAECSPNPAARCPPPPRPSPPSHTQAHTHLPRTHLCTLPWFVELASSHGFVECVVIMPNRQLSITKMFCSAFLRYAVVLCAASWAAPRGCYETWHR